MVHQWQLIVAAVLVLGSWIGFRRSIHRSQYEVKFFNLPFLMFIADQLMIILYFRIATLTDIRGKGAADPWGPGDAHTGATRGGLHPLRDLGLSWGGAWRTLVRACGPADRPKYPEIDDDKKMTDEAYEPSGAGLCDDSGDTRGIGPALVGLRFAISGDGHG